MKQDAEAVAESMAALSSTVDSEIRKIEKKLRLQNADLTSGSVIISPSFLLQDSKTPAELSLPNCSLVNLKEP